MVTYRRKPTTIEAIQWNGANLFEIMEFTKSTFSGGKRAVNFLYEKGEKANLWVDANKAWLEIEVGEWVAKDRHGCYPIKDDVFADNYEEVPEPLKVGRIEDLTREQYQALTDEQKKARMDQQRAYSAQFPPGKYPMRDQIDPEYQRYADFGRAEGYNPPGIYT